MGQELVEVLRKEGPDEKNAAERYASYLEAAETIIVSMLEYFGIEVNPGRDNEGGHRFHEATLQTLANKDNPPHGLLGQSEVIRLLHGAKQFRNRWRNRGPEDVSILQVLPGIVDIRSSLEMINGRLDAVVRCVRKDNDRRERSEAYWERMRELDKREILVNKCSEANWEKMRLAGSEFTFRENALTLKAQELGNRETLVEEQRKETTKVQHALREKETQLKLYHDLSKLYQDIISMYRLKYTPGPGGTDSQITRIQHVYNIEGWKKGKTKVMQR